MNRLVAFLLALLFASVTVSSACVAAPGDWISFSLEPQRGSNQIKATFHDESRGRGENHWSTDFLPGQLVGLDVAGFRATGSRPLRFAVVREAGRLDCSGNGGGSRASGNCAFAANPAFTNLLVSRGIGRPTHEQAIGLMAVDARRELIEAIAVARYPAPTIDNLMALTAVGVTGRYIADLARAGYRPHTVQAVVEFKALGITPDWIGGFARIGYANVPSDELIQLKALDITPEFVSGFDRIGYRHLPVDTLVQLKALNITPDFVRSGVGESGTMPPVSELVELKMLGRRH
jgi:hypothetical protein